MSIKNNKIYRILAIILVLAICFSLTPNVLAGSNDLLDWGVDMIDADKIWGKNDGAVNVFSEKPAGQGVKICILDTGIDIDHPDLDDNIKGGRNYIDFPYTGSYNDLQGHGTQMAGVIAAEDNGIGIIGVAPKSSLYIIKVGWSEASIHPLSCIWGINWAIDNEMDIISMSIGWPEGVGWVLDTAFRNALHYAHEEGIILVGASGNEWNEQVNFPASHGDVIAVGAVEEDLSIYYGVKEDDTKYGSNHGTGLNLVAPGVEIITTEIGGGTSTQTGTSLSCAFVAGVCALILSANPTLYSDRSAYRADRVRDLLLENTIDLENSFYFGNGFVDAYNTLDLPSVTITSPGSYVNGNKDTATVSADVSDGRGIIERVEFYIGNTLKYTDYDGSDGYLWVWDISHLGDGYQKIKIKAWDDEGFYGLDYKKVYILSELYPP